MYRINNIIDIKDVPNAIEKCIVSEHVLLKFVYENLNNDKCDFNVNVLRSILIRHIRNEYTAESVSDIELSRSDIQRIFKKH